MGNAFRVTFPNRPGPMPRQASALKGKATARSMPEENPSDGDLRFWWLAGQRRTAAWVAAPGDLHGETFYAQGEGDCPTRLRREKMTLWIHYHYRRNPDLVKVFVVLRFT